MLLPAVKYTTILLTMPQHFYKPHEPPLGTYSEGVNFRTALTLAEPTITVTPTTCQALFRPPLFLLPVPAH